MLKKILLLTLLQFMSFQLVAQERPALLNKFSKEISRGNHESSLTANKNLILNTITEKKEKSTKKKSSKYLKKLKEELSLLASTIQYDNYNLLNELIANDYFKKISFGTEPIQAGAAIELRIKNNVAVGLDDMLSNYPIIKEKHHISVKEEISETKTKDYKAKYAANDADYAKYLLKQIEALLDDHKKTLDCKFKDYIDFEANQQYKSIPESIAFRQHFIAFCWERIE